MNSKNYNGILVIDKPAGPTSHDVVIRVRKLLGQRKAGHAGTLDPAATGILLVCVGSATRLTEYLVRSTKEYRAVVHFGVATNTFDAEGEIVASSSVEALTRVEVEATLRSFVGQIEQQVPAFSAVKKEGIALYKLARRGRAVDPPKRMVEINAIQVLAWEKPRAVIRVECQAGTYIRSLAHDAGQRLGVGAHLAELTRTRSGDWRLETAIDLEALARVAHKGDVEAVLHPLDAAIQFMPKITLSAREAQQAIYGQELRLDLPPYAMTIRAYTPRDEFLAILERSSNQTWQPRKVFPPA